MSLRGTAVPAEAVWSWYRSWGLYWRTNVFSVNRR
eukprot:gene42935-999_t